ncbi:MAG: heme ABC exporter ATP-binding protein CcmA [Alphaproteobacteria bacterium]|nr:heme ABC exporter ATP-binding protein CcmA [Alphaproteobacteria bacterium]
MMVLEACDLACLRGDRVVFEHVGFRLGPGEVLLLEGPNGSGKSSLLRLLAGFLTPLAGRVLWQERDIAEEGEDYRRAIAYVGHLDAVKPMLSVEANLRFWADLHGAGGQALERALDFFELAELRDLPARLLSAGQRRRLNLSRLRVREARLWLLDEPSVSLDRHSVALLGEAMEAHRAGGGMIVAATHLDLGLAGAARLRLGGETGV